MSYVVVTGASGALGAAVVGELVARQIDVVAIGSARGERALRALAESAGRRCRAVVADVASPGDWQRVVRELDERGGAPAGAVLAAGAWAGGGPLSTRPNDWRAMMSSNADTAHASLAALLPSMTRAGRGSIVLVGSRAALRPESSAGAAAYAASKAALVALAAAVAAEVLDAGVRVNVVLPSVIDTPANRAAMPDADTSRWVTTSAIARVIAYLLSDDAAPISGASVPVYGRS